jgi:histidinol dehydrogenase
MKKSNLIAYTREELTKVKDHLSRIAQMEGLDAHAKSVESRHA